MLALSRQIIQFYINNLLDICLIIIPVALPVIFIHNFILPNYIPAENFTQFRLASTLVDWFFIPLYVGALIVNFHHKINNLKTSTAICFLTSIRLWPNLFLVTVATSIIIGVGLMLLVIPGIYLFIRLSLTDFLVVLDQQSPIESIKNSYHQTKTHQWLILECVTLFYLPVMVAGFFYPEMISRFPDSEIAKIVSQLSLYVLGTVITVVLFRFYCLIFNNDVEQPDNQINRSENTSRQS